MKRKLVIFCCFLLLASSWSFSSESKPLDSRIIEALKSIKPTEAYNLTRIMSSSEYAGRLTGHEGYTSAAKWAAEFFNLWGLKPINESSGYLQAYPSPYTVIEKAEMSLYLFKPGESGKESSYEEVSLKIENDFLPLLFSDSGENTAEVVFVGWGISAPDLNYDDYDGVDVKGKFVLCFRGTPERDEKFQHHDEHRTRMKTAKEKGALGLIYIYPEPLSNPNGDWLPEFTPAIISEKAADMLLKEIGANSAELKKALQTYKRPISFPLKSKIHYKVDSQHFPHGIGYNVIGYVEGSDPRLKTECLVIGGHFDHTGTHTGLLFPGANDNASGSAVVMTIAKTFSDLKLKPRRPVVFVLFGGEEMGLQGSSYFVENIPAPFKKIAAMFNFDMVGVGDGAGAGISVGFPELKDYLEIADAHVGILRSTRTIRHVGVRGSDYAPFHSKGIPCISFVSNGPHLFYHQTRDTIYRINPDIMADIARLAFLTSFFIADR